MIVTLFQLPDQVQTNLKYASCIGKHVFPERRLRTGGKQNEEDVDMQLKLAEKLCIIRESEYERGEGENNLYFSAWQIQCKLR